MKKILMLIPVLSIGMLIAKEEEKAQTTRVNRDVEVQRELDNAKVVRYTVTIYRNETQYDKEAWQKTVEDTARIIELGSHEGNDAEFVEGIVNSINRMHKRSNMSDGIHGEIKVGLGDGVCACANGCDCAQKYKGICPCGALDGSDCKSEKIRCPGHRN